MRSLLITNVVALIVVTILHLTFVSLGLSIDSQHVFMRLGLIGAYMLIISILSMLHVDHWEKSFAQTVISQMNVSSLFASFLVSFFIVHNFSDGGLIENVISGAAGVGVFSAFYLLCSSGKDGSSLVILAHYLNAASIALLLVSSVERAWLCTLGGIAALEFFEWFFYRRVRTYASSSRHDDVSVEAQAIGGNDTKQPTDDPTDVYGYSSSHR
jgi:hypothetical protein